MHTITTAPRGTKKIFHDGEWKTVTHLKPDKNPQLTPENQSRGKVQHAKRHAINLLRKPETVQRETIRKQLLKQKEAALKALIGVDRMNMKIREDHANFLFVSDSEINKMLAEKVQLAYG